MPPLKAVPDHGLDHLIVPRSLGPHKDLCRVPLFWDPPRSLHQKPGINQEKFTDNAAKGDHGCYEANGTSDVQTQFTGIIKLQRMNQETRLDREG